MDKPEDILAARTAAAEALLTDALRVEIAAFVSRQVEERLRARPHFFARTPNVAMVGIRRDLERHTAALVERAAAPVLDLRVFLGATAHSEAEEAQALANGLAFVVKEVREVLNNWVFPGDSRPDRADDTAVDLDAEWTVRFVPSPNLMWAWRKVRALDTARNQLADAPAGQPAQPTTELRLYLPEALEDDLVEKKKR